MKAYLDEVNIKVDTIGEGIEPYGKASLTYILDAPLNSIWAAEFPETIEIEKGEKS